MQGNYFYNSIVSSGPGIEFLGGNVDSKNNIVNQRYSGNLKFMHAKEKYAVFLGPVLSFDNTDLNALRDEFSHVKGAEPETSNNNECPELFERMGSSIGYNSGAGFLLGQNFGLTLGHSFDWMHTGNYIISFSTSIAYNLRKHFEKLINNTENFWLELEYSISPNQREDNTHRLILGLAMGF